MFTIDAILIIGSFCFVAALLIMWIGGLPVKAYSEPYYDVDYRPAGYRFCLYDVKTQVGNKFVVAENSRRAVILAHKDGGKSTPINIKPLMKSFGNKYTNIFLQHFGSEWVLKQGWVYYRHGPGVF